MNSVVSRRRQAEKQARAQRKKCEKSGKRPVLEALSLPEDVTGNAARLTVLGSARLLAENIMGIAEVTRTRVRLTTAEGMLAVSGENLMLTDVRCGALCVSGRITQIELPVRREAAYD